MAECRKIPNHSHLHRLHKTEMIFAGIVFQCPRATVKAMVNVFLDPLPI